MFSNKGCSNQCCKPKCERKCDCKSEKMETQLQCCWELNTICQERVLFTAPNQCDLTAFGTIKYNCSTSIPCGLIRVNFYKGSPKCGCLVDTFLIDEGGCTTFVASDFNTIAACLIKGGPAQGEICITPFFQVN